MIRILVTGSRDWGDKDAIRAQLSGWLADTYGVLAEQADVTLVHGGARGADRLAAQVAEEFGWNIEEHPAEWEIWGRSAGHRRNAEMVADGADVCLAFPRGESRGTRGCMAMAERAGIPVVVVEAKVGAA